VRCTNPAKTSSSSSGSLTRATSARANTFARSLRPSADYPWNRWCDPPEGCASCTWLQVPRQARRSLRRSTGSSIGAGSGSACLPLLFGFNISARALR
jgi:hypothetical protein